MVEGCGGADGSGNKIIGWVVVMNPFLPTFCPWLLFLPAFCPRLPPKLNTDKQNPGGFARGQKNHSITTSLTYGNLGEFSPVSERQ